MTPEPSVRLLSNPRLGPSSKWRLVVGSHCVGGAIRVQPVVERRQGVEQSRVLPLDR
jgi:hypothetical protein